MAGNYELIVNQYTNGATGHVDVTLTEGAPNPSIVAGFNAHGFPMQNSTLQSGWFDESSYQAQMQSEGYFFNKQVISISLKQYITLSNYLKNQMAATKNMTLSAGYGLLGNNCVDGIQNLLNMAGINGHTVDFMKPNLTSVYMYAAIQKGTYFVPAPLSPGGSIPFHSLISLTGALTGYVGTGADYVINSAFGLTGATGTQQTGVPYLPPTGVIVVTANKATHTLSIDYSQAQNISLYDNNGNVIGTSPITGQTYLPQDIANEMLNELDTISQIYDFSNGVY